MSQNSLPGLDLPALPPQVRAGIEKRFAAMSPEVRARWTAGGAPLLARLMNSLAAAGHGQAEPTPTPGRSGDADTPRYQPTVPVNPDRMEPHGHYNDTVRPGDTPGSSAWTLIVALLLGIAAVLLF